jgi:hypothetical protein
MIKFKIDEQEYKLPEFISVENYSKIYKVKDLFSDDYFAAKIVSIVTDAPLEDLLQADYQEVQYLAAYLMSLVPLEKPKFIDRFEIDGVKYGFFPDWKDLSFAEFVDMDTISTKKADELLDLLHILAAVMYRPITEEKSEHDYKIEKYDVDSMKVRAEIFKKKLDIKYVLGAQFFFINYANRFLSYSHLSLIPKLSIWMKVKLLWMMRKWIWAGLISKKPLDGSLSSTELLKTIIQSTKLSTNQK